VSQSFLFLCLKTFRFSVNPRQLHITISNGVFLLRNRLVEILQLLVETGKMSKFLRMQCLCSFQLRLGGNGVNAPNLRTAPLNLYRGGVSSLVLVLELLTHRFCCHLDIRDSLFNGGEICLELFYFHVNKTPRYGRMRNLPSSNMTVCISFCCVFIITLCFWMVDFCFEMFVCKIIEDEEIRGGGIVHVP